MAKISTGKLFTIILFVGILFMILRPITDADFWWHLATGRWMAQTGEIPRTDPFSFTAAGSPWVAHEWLTERLMYFLDQVGGFPLLILIFSGLITLAYGFAYLRAPFMTHPYFAGFAVLLSAAMSAPLWGVRPQMITLLFVSVFLYLLDRFSNIRNARLLIFLPVLMLAWVNLHAGYFIGLVIISIYLFAVLLQYAYVRVRRISPPEELRFKAGWLALCLAASTLTTIANPNGAQILLYPFQTLTDPAMQTYIQEWYPPDFRQAIWLPFFLSLLLTVGAGVFARKRFSLTNLLLLVVFGYLGLRSMRHVPLFAVVCAPILAELVQSLIPGSAQLGLGGRRSWLYSLVAVLLLIPLGLRFYQVTRQQPAVERAQYPAGAVEWIRGNHPGGNLFNSYTWGGYLIWHLAQDYPVFIDGRADLYGPEFFENFASIYQAGVDHHEVFSTYDVRIVLVEPGSAIAAELVRSGNWKVEFEDDTSVLLIED